MDEHPSVVLVSQHVHARVYRRYALVECVFFLRNGGSETAVEIGFPHYDDDAKRRFEYFESYVDGRRVDVAKEKNEGGGPSLWYTKEVAFAAGELKTIRNVYKGGISRDTSRRLWFTLWLAGATPTHVFSVTDYDYLNNEPIILNRVDDPIHPLSHPVFILARKLLTTRRPGLFPKTPNPFDYSSSIFPIRNVFDLLGGRRLDHNLISCHGASGPSPRPQTAVPALKPALRTQQYPRRPLQGQV